MGFAGRDLISINDFTKGEIEAVLDLADEMNSRLEKGEPIELCKGMDMATLFYEPSTRTRGSFERAMHKLGGTVVSFADAETTSSVAKGETIADTVRVLENYADLIVLRHPLEGAAKVAADYACVPIINAGDGGHEHPTQTLCDLYTLKKEKGTIKDLIVVLWGDLKNGRTVHSLIYALARFGAFPLCCTEPHLEPPKGLVEKLRRQHGHVLKKVRPQDLKQLIRTGVVDALYISPFQPHQPPLAGLDDGHSIEVTISEVWDKARDVDAVYVTRLQVERATGASDTELGESYSVMNGELLGELDKKKTTLVMHPLPRVNELPYQYDKYPRSIYFQQAAHGVPVRMALIALLLGATQIDIPQGDESFLGKTVYGKCKEAVGVKCLNPNCILKNERETRWISPEFRILKGQPLTLTCVYCDHDTHPPYIATSEWHDGTLDKKRYYSSDSFMLERIRPENLIIFGSEEKAQVEGFKRSQYATTRKKVRGGAQR